MRDADLIAQLKNAKTSDHRLKPDASWVAQTRATVKQHATSNGGAQVNDNQPSKVSQLYRLFVPNTLKVFFKPVAAFALAILVTSGGWIATVGATAGSVPGDATYGLKLATEQMGDFVAETFDIASTPKEKAQKRVTKNINRVEKRVDEIREAVSKMQQEMNVEKKEKITKAIEDTATNHIVPVIKETKESFDEIVANEEQGEAETSVEIVEVAKEISIKSDEVTKVLTEVEREVKSVKNATPENGGDDVSTDAVERVIDETKKAVFDSGVETIETVIKNQVPGSEEAVRDLVEQKINVVTEDLLKTKEEFDSVSGGENADDSESVPVAPDVTNTSTQDLGVTVGEVKSVVIEQAKQQVEEVAREAEDLVEKKEQLTSTDSSDAIVEEVIQQLKNLSEAAEEAEAFVDEVKKVVAEEEALEDAQTDSEMSDAEEDEQEPAVTEE